MALGDYILCCKCEVKLIYDGDRGNREWWEERWNKEPEILCPDCQVELRAENERLREVLKVLLENGGDYTAKRDAAREALENKHD